MKPDLFNIGNSMILDSNLIFSARTTSRLGVGADAVSFDKTVSNTVAPYFIDIGADRDMGSGQPIYFNVIINLNVLVLDAATKAKDYIIVRAFLSSDYTKGATIASPEYPCVEIHLSLAEIAASKDNAPWTITAAAVIAPLPSGKTQLRFLGVL